MEICKNTYFLDQNFTTFKIWSKIGQEKSREKIKIFSKIFDFSRYQAIRLSGYRTLGYLENQGIRACSIVNADPRLRTQDSRPKTDDRWQRTDDRR